MDQAPGERGSSGRDRAGADAMFEELTRVNNELANVQRELTKRNVELVRLNEQKNRLLGMAAHDLRSPLGIIQSYSEFLEDEAGPVLTAEQLEFVTIIRDTSKFMLRLVDDLLDITAIEAGQLRLDREPANLEALVRHNVQLNHVLGARKRIEVDFASDGAPLIAPVDGGKIEQVLNNLISNAIKFSHAGT
ncbi:MAG: HAMP domain-containing sensor histidine kinase, partial [Gemmatimonadota bacterium]